MGIESVDLTLNQTGAKEDLIPENTLNRRQVVKWCLMWLLPQVDKPHQ